jgi:molybdate transport system regulatory protein
MPRPSSKVDVDVALEGARWLRQGGSLTGGADRVALLEAIRDTGSMTHAAKAVGISYKTAWDRVQGMNNGAGRPLVERSAGGAGGGGTRLTPYAVEMIAAFRELERTHAQLLGRLSTSMAQPGEVLRSLAALGLRTSARNQLAGTVAEVRRGAVNAELALALPGGSDRIHASLTMASLRELGLKKGVAAVALIKAPSVFIALGDGDGAGDGASGSLSVSVRNVLRGVVTAIHAGTVNTEVQARLAGGQTMVAMLSRDSAQRLALQVGAPVRLLFPESSVILGVV